MSERGGSSGRRGLLGLSDRIHPKQSLQWGNSTLGLVVRKGGESAVMELSRNAVPINWKEVKTELARLALPENAGKAWYDR